METLPPLVGALGLATLFSAEVNSSDAILFILSTSLSQDLYRRFVRPAASDADLLRVARWAAIAGGVSLAVVAQVSTAGQGIGGLTPAMCGLVAAGVAWVAASLVSQGTSGVLS